MTITSNKGFFFERAVTELNTTKAKMAVEVHPTVCCPPLSGASRSVQTNRESFVKLNNCRPPTLIHMRFAIDVQYHTLGSAPIQNSNVL